MKAEQDWGMVQIGKDEEGAVEVLLENSQLRVRYARAFMGDGPERGGEPPYETFIREFFIKSVDQDQINDIDAKHPSELIDAGAWRSEMTGAEITQNEPDRITVRMEWDCYKWKPNIQEVTIYKDRPYIRIDYLEFFVNVVDIATPGGTREGTYTIYGAENWIRPYTYYPKMYFDRCPADIGYENMTEIEDSTPLDYNGWFVMGIYNQENGIGYGRVAQVEAIDVIKLLFEEERHGKRGFELFPCFHRSHNPFTSYLYAFTGGAESALRLGKQIADSHQDSA